MKYSFEGNGFTLRPYKKSDEESMIKHLNDKNVSKYMLLVPYPYTKADAKKWTKRCLAWNRKKNPEEYFFTIDVNGKKVGGISLKDIEEHKAEIGYWLGKKYWNQGIVTHAVKLITSFGFNKLKLKRIFASIHPKNKKSMRILAKNGYKKEGVLRKNRDWKGKIDDEVIYAKIK